MEGRGRDLLTHHLIGRTKKNHGNHKKIGLWTEIRTAVPVNAKQGCQQLNRDVGRSMNKAWHCGVVST